MKILREIRRLTEEIEQLKSSLDSLDRLIRYSRISVSLVPRIDETGELRQGSRSPGSRRSTLSP